VHGQFGEKQTFPKHNGGIVNIRGMSPYPTVTTPLKEGVTPKGNQMNFYYVEVPVYQYGSFTPITDYAQFASRDDVLIHDSEELSSQAGRTIEEIDAAVLNSGDNVIYAPAVASDGTETEVTTRKGITKLSKITVDVIFRALNFMEVQNAEPIGDSFVAIIHPNVKYDIMRNKDFIDVMKYAHSEKILKGEIGMIGNIRFVMSTFAKVFSGEGASGIDVYSTLVIAKDAYKVLEIEGEGMKTIIKPLGSAGAGDPLDQRATQGWKTTHGIGITSQTCIVRIESSSALNTKTA
jgi:N4-gp56 family major capsid protein